MPSDRSASSNSHNDPNSKVSEADQSVRTDASTVFRAGSEVETGAQPEQPFAASAEIAEARTVIRQPADAENRSSQPHTSQQGSSSPLRNLPPPTRQSPAAVAKVLVGSQMGKFRVDELIGGGGMGAVFLAHDEDLDRPVAIKVIPFVEDDPDLQRRFRNECQLVAKLDHPNISKVYDTGNHGEWHYIVFEYIEGVNMRDWVMDHGPLPIDDAVFFTAELADALQHLASKEIVHRDVKPSNVLLSPDGSIKLVDLGLARSGTYDFTDDMTASGVTLGTFDYISPEQAKDARAADLRSDIYSLGCTLYFMLTGQPPYPGGSMMNKLMSHSSEPHPDPRNLRPDVHADLVKSLNKMMAKKVDHRYQTGDDLVSDLRNIAVRNGFRRSMGLTPVAASQANRFASLLETHLPWMVAVGLTILVAAWFHLDARTSRAEIVVPSTAKQPVVIEDFPMDSGPVPLEFQSGTEFQNSMASENRLGDSNAELMANFSSEPSGPDSSQEDLASEVVKSQPSITVKMPSNLLTDDPASLMSVEGPSDLRRDAVVDSLQDRTAAMSQVGGVLDSAGQRIRVRYRDGRLVDLIGNEFVPSVVRVVSGLKTGEMFRFGDEELHVEALADAFVIAEVYQLEKIDLACKFIETPPIAVQTENLRLESSVDDCVVRFQSNDVVSMSRPVMCDLGNSVIEFEGVHFVWELPENEVDGGTLFEMNAGGQLRMTDCTITIDNPALRDEVFAIGVITDPDRIVDPEERRLAMSDAFPLVAIDFADVVVRGQMTMVHMDYASKLWLTWDNGLLAITDRMIDTAGARAPVASASGPIKLSLSRVTAHTAKGVCRVRLGVSGSYPFIINRAARSCLFMVDPTRPHFDVINFPESVERIRGTDSITESTGGSASTESFVPLRLDGSFNAYLVQSDKDDPLLRIGDVQGDVWTATMDDLASQRLPWADENLPRWNVIWNSKPSLDRSVLAIKPADYRQEGTLSPGFDEETLPVPPDIADWVDLSGVGFETDSRR